MLYKVIFVYITVIILHTTAAGSKDACIDCIPVYICANGILIFNDIFILDTKNGRTYENPPTGFRNYRKQSNCSTMNVAQHLFRQLTKSFYVSSKNDIEYDEKCGFRNENGLIFRISGAKNGEAQFAEFPWMAAIMKVEHSNDGDFNIYQCGGSLIHPRVVLSAAHCVWNKNVKQLLIRLGEWDTQRTTEPLPHQDFSVSDIIWHPEFDPSNLYNDIALIFLDHDAELAGNVGIICLPHPDIQYNKKDCIVTGWGKDEFGKTGRYQVILKQIGLPIVPQNSCQASLRKTRLGRHFRLHESFICAGGVEGKDTCKGDGGSPLVCRIDHGTKKQYVQVGIVAWGIGCGTTSLPGVYANIPIFSKWINEQIKTKI